MFERFTSDGQQVVVLAQEEARNLRHDHIGSEHVLLGLLTEPDALAGRIPRSHGPSSAEARAQVAERVGHADQVTHGSLSFTDSARQALDLAPAEADALGDGDGEHFLLGLIHRIEGIGDEVIAGRK